MTACSKGSRSGLKTIQRDLSMDFVLKDGSDGSHLRQGNQSDDKGRVDRFPCFAILEKVTQTVLQSAALFLRRVVDECEDVPPTAMRL